MTRRSPWPAAAFLLFALPVLLFLAIRVPAGETPDEVAHIIRIDSLLHGAIIGYRGTRLDGAGNTVPDSGVTANPGLLAAGFAFIPGTPLAQRVLSRARVAALKALPWADHAGYVSVPNTAVYPPIFYIPGAVAMGAARLLGFGPRDAIVAARLAAALAYLAIGGAALLLAGRLQGLLLAVLLLPISLWLGASCNQDGLMIATAVLAAALLTRGTRRAWWCGALAVAAIVMAKPPYLPLAGVVAATLPGRVAPLMTRAVGALLAGLPGVGWYLLAQARATVPFVRGAPYAGGPNWFGDPARTFTVIDPALQFQVLLHHPSLIVTLPFDALIDRASWLAWEIVGILGVIDIVLPSWLYMVWLVALVALVFGESLVPPRSASGPGLFGSIVVLACVAATVAAIFDGQYLSWTPTGWATVEGVQGRYFVPLLPFLGLALPALDVPGGRVLRGVLRLPTAAAGLAGLVVIPALVVSIYYLR